MSLRVLSAASDTKLCVLSDLKTRLGISASTYDTLLTSLIGIASRTIVSEIRGRELARQRYEEKIAGRDRLRLQLSRWPIDPDSVTLTVDGTAETDFSVERPSMLFRSDGWPSYDTTPGQEGSENVVVTYKGGYVLPNWIATWATGAKTAGAWARPSTPTLSPLLFECTTGGTSGATEPTWPAVGLTVTDGSVVWTARDAEELPDDIEEACILATSLFYRGGMDIPGNIAAEHLGPMEIQYFAGTEGRDVILPRAAKALLEAYRW